MFDATLQSAPMAAAQSFRDILDCLARPGSVVQIRHATQTIGRLEPGSFTLLTTLCDYQTPIFLSPQMKDAATLKRLKFATSAPFTDDPAAAAFAVVNADEVVDLLSGFSIGTHEYPDRSTTVIIQLPADASGLAPVIFRGPGIAEIRSVPLPGVTNKFWRTRQQINNEFPIGLDIVFVQGNSLIGCPRSTRVELSERT